MKKYITGFLTALAVMIILSLINQELFKISQFIIGWFSCTGYYVGEEASK